MMKKYNLCKKDKWARSLDSGLLQQIFKAYSEDMVWFKYEVELRQVEEQDHQLNYSQFSGEANLTSELSQDSLELLPRNIVIEEEVHSKFNEEQQRIVQELNIQVAKQFKKQVEEREKLSYRHTDAFTTKAKFNLRSFAYMSTVAKAPEVKKKRPKPTLANTDTEFHGTKRYEELMRLYDDEYATTKIKREKNGI